MSNQTTASTVSEQPSQQPPSEPPKEKHNILNDFQKIKIIGEGSFGLVHMAKKINDTSDRLYAIKEVKMSILDKEQKHHQVFMEKLQIYLDCPGIPKMYACSKHRSSIFFIMDYAGGGSFDQFLRFNSGRLNFKTIQFYIAEMVVILEYLHTRGLAHRDFKPGNMVLTKEKHLQLIDFGTLHDYCHKLLPPEMKRDVDQKNTVKADTIKKRSMLLEQTSDDNENGEPQTEIRSRNMTFCGTNDYLSPEMLLDYKCDMNGDLWALGCIVYQLSAGKTPFQSKYPIFEQLRQKIVNGEYSFPQNTPATIQDLVEKLLRLEPSERLGGVRVSEELTLEEVQSNYAKLKSHAFFEGVQWDTLFSQEAPMKNDSIIVRNPNKKMTAPPVSTLASMAKALGNEQEEEEVKQPPPPLYEAKTETPKKMKKGSADFRSPESERRSKPISMFSSMVDDSKSSNNESFTCSISEPKRVLFEGIFYEKVKLFLRHDVRIIVWDEPELTLRVFESNNPSKQRHKIILDSSVQLKNKPDRLKIIINKDKTKTFIDHKNSRTADLYYFLTKKQEEQRILA